MTDEQAREQYAKLKQIDEFAKSLGFTIYKIVADFKVDNETFTLSDTTLNERN